MSSHSADYHTSLGLGTPYVKPTVAFVEELLRIHESSQIVAEVKGAQVAKELTPKSPKLKRQLSPLAPIGDVAKYHEWTVQVHPESGQVYYSDVNAGESIWYDPFNDVVAGPVLIEEQLDEMAENDTVAAMEALAGFDSAPNRNVFEKDPAAASLKRLSDWCEEEGLGLGADDEAQLFFPEYLNIKRQFSGEKTILINILLPKANTSSSGVSNITIKARLDMQLGEMMEAVFDEYHSKTSKILDPMRNSYVFKLVGYHDYLLQKKIPIGYYDCAYECCSLNESSNRPAPVKLELHLIRLSAAVMMDLQSVFSKELKDFVRIEEDKHRPDGDMWTETENSVVPPDIAFAAEHKMVLELEYLRQRDVNWPLRVLVNGITQCPREITCDFVRVEMNVFYNGESLLVPTKSVVSTSSTNNSTSEDTNVICTKMVPLSAEPRFPQNWLNSGLDVSLIPSNARIVLMLAGFTKEGAVLKKSLIAGVALTINDYAHRLRSGNMVVQMFPFPALQKARDPARFQHDEEPDVLNLTSCVCGENSRADSGGLYLTFDSYTLPIICDATTLNEIKAKGLTFSVRPISDPNIEKFFDYIEKKDPLYSLTEHEKMGLWERRRECTQRPRLLPKLLQAVPWKQLDAVLEMRQLLFVWAPLDPYAALELLDIRYSDPVVREFAIRVIDELEDDQLSELLLQLVQVLKYESYHDSPLARFLLRRALKSPLKIGHNLYWMLKSEMHSLGVFERFGVVLLTYIKFCGPHRASLRKQLFVNDRLKIVADQIKSIPDATAQLTRMRSELDYLIPSLPTPFSVCLTPRIECIGIKVEKCKVMDSKKKPLWIVFENADRDGKDFYTIYKSGDDLRQDQLTLQLLRAMGLLWKGADALTQKAIANGQAPGTLLDLRLNPYRCCSTGHNLGMIEVVVNSNTTANIMKEFGGVTGAFSRMPINLYLLKNNPEALYPVAVDNFVHTCAGYCVATYVLGIGDRHASNIMITASGHLFHIDFGHFLGNFKSKFGIRRERSPFVFTTEMEYVMSNNSNDKNSSYSKFEEMCCEAYNMLRQRANMFINMFLLMVPAGMPELLDRSDITYLVDMLDLSLSKDAADEKFKQEIKNALGTVSRKVDNFIHTMKH